MRSRRSLNPNELQELEQWMASREIKLNNRTRRQLSDVVNVARILKQLDPRLVDMYNYSSHSSLALKLENWEIFNLKVLRKVGYALSREELEQLAAGSLTALKSLLYQLMCTERHGFNPQVLLKIRPQLAQASAGDSPKTREPLDTGSSQILPAQTPTEDQMLLSKVSHKNIAFTKYKQLLRETRRKEKYISSVRSKVQYLQSLILVKEERINRLTTRLATLSAQAALQE